MLNQSFRQVFVTNSPALLASGKTVEALADGQIAILDGKTHKAVTAPTYATNKALEVVWGTPDLSGLPLMSGANNQNEYSKLIKGKLLKGFRGHRANRGQTQIVTIGFSGDVADTNTLSAKVGEIKHLFITLTGNPIDKLYSKQGITRQYSAQIGYLDDCTLTDPCATVDPIKLANEYVKQINADPAVNRLIKASTLVSCSPALPAPTTDTDYVFDLVVSDGQQPYAQGLVQAQYPNDFVSRLSYAGIATTYRIVRDTNSLPAAFSNQGIVVIPDCPVCPAGYTLLDNNFAYQVTKQDAGDAAALAAVVSQYGIDGTESVSRIGYEFGRSTYVVVSDTALTSIPGTNEQQSLIATGASAGTFTLTFDGETTAAIAFNANAAAVQSALEALSNINPGDVTVAGGPLPGTATTITFGGQYAGTNVPAITANSGSLTGGTATITTPTAGVPGAGTLQLLGNARNTCVLTSPTTIAWVANGTLTKYAKKFRISLADDVCGVNRLAALQAAYPNNVVTIVNAGGSCVHTYEATVFSNAVAVGCQASDIVYVKPQSFEGVEWVEVPDAAIPGGTTCLTGIQLEVAFVDRTTNEATFDYFVGYEPDTVYISASNYNPDYNDSPNEASWVVKTVRGVKFPQGTGSWVRELEKKSKGYALRDRSFDPSVREIYGQYFQARPEIYYDEYVLEFNFRYGVGGWSTEYNDSYHLHVFFPEGQGKAFEAAINGYISSAALNIDPVSL